jgi:hypothetical protein
MYCSERSFDAEPDLCLCGIRLPGGGKEHPGKNHRQHGDHDLFHIIGFFVEDKKADTRILVGVSELYAEIRAKAMTMIEIAIITDMPVRIIIGAAIIHAAREKQMRTVPDLVTQMGVFCIGGCYSLQVFETDPRIPAIGTIVEKNGEAF